MVKARHGTGWAHRVPRVLKVATFASPPPASAATAHARGATAHVPGALAHSSGATAHVHDAMARSHAVMSHLPGAMALPQAAMAPLGFAAHPPRPPLSSLPLPPAVITEASTVLRVTRFR